MAYFGFKISDTRDSSVCVWICFSSVPYLEDTSKDEVINLKCFFLYFFRQNLLLDGQRWTSRCWCGVW